MVLTLVLPVNLPGRLVIRVTFGDPAEVEDEVAEKIVNIRPKAMDHLQKLRQSQGNEVDIFLRMGVRSGGCSGLSYIMDLVQKVRPAHASRISSWVSRSCAICAGLMPGAYNLPVPKGMYCSGSF